MKNHIKLEEVSKGTAISQIQNSEARHLIFRFCECLPAFEAVKSN